MAPDSSLLGRNHVVSFEQRIAWHIYNQTVLLAADLHQVQEVPCMIDANAGYSKRQADKHADTVNRTFNAESCRSLCGEQLTLASLLHSGPCLFQTSTPAKLHYSCPTVAPAQERICHGPLLSP